MLEYLVKIFQHKYSERSLSLCRSVHLKSHTDNPESEIVLCTEKPATCSLLGCPAFFYGF